MTASEHADRRMTHADPRIALLAEQLAAAEQHATEAERQLREKRQELAVAYGGGRTAEEGEWFSALDRVRAERDVLEAALRDIDAASQITPAYSPNPVNAQAAMRRINSLARKALAGVTDTTRGEQESGGDG